MLKIMLPTDGTEKSLDAVKWVKEMFPQDTTEILLLLVREDVDRITDENQLHAAQEESRDFLDVAAQELSGFRIVKTVVFGQASEEILASARQNDVNLIVLMRATKHTWSHAIGSVAAHVIKYARRPVLLVPDPAHMEPNISESMEDTVILHNQLSPHASSTLLPAQVGRCLYEITVLKGTMRLTHTAFSFDDGTWSSPPFGNQPARYDLDDGEEQQIALTVSLTFGKLDHIEAINTDWRKPLVFHYKATFLDTLVQTDEETSQAE